MAAMATWTPLVLAVTLLALVTQGSTVEQPLSEESKVVSALGQMSRVLQCSRDVQQSSWRSCEASLGVQQDSLSILQDLQLQRGNSSSSLDHLSEAVATLTRLNMDLSKKLADKDTKALAGVEELERECEAKERKVENLTQYNMDLQNQQAAEKVKVKSLTQENVNLQNQLAVKDKALAGVEELKTECEAKERKVGNLTQEIVNLKKQITDKVNQATTLAKEGYDYISGFGFYKFHSQARTWDDAVKVCQSEGTHLGIVNSVEEAEVYTSIIASHPLVQDATNNHYFHSGFKEIGNTRQFLTLDGVELSESGYSDWKSGEPNSYGSNENCGSINPNAKFNDEHCDYMHAFICELEYV